MWSANKKIRVMVVDDSILARTILTQGLGKSPRIEVVGTAFNPQDAMAKIPQLKPDVITSDVEMPGMSGIDFLKLLLPKYPVPVILVSSLNLRVFDALSAGAVDFVRKPEAGQGNDAFINALTMKVISAAGAKVRQAPAGITKAAPVAPLGQRANLDQVIIGLGASTGGTEATLEVLKRLPADIPGMLIVQHMPTGFTQMYAERLNRLCNMEVREAKNGDEVRRGLALLAPADYQMRIVRSGTRYTVSCAQGEKVSGHRPSVDALFFSMAEQVRCKMVGIIMTGMGRDGADGLLQMRKAGAFTIGQDKESCVVYGMPMVAQNIGAVQIQASCENISSVLLRQLNTL
ncbi:MAG: chemotaxis response regulator protein-glutamate methylesterase [Oscillospiraceae bacterium]|jgi:two-component system chemotaxis response regulator CheB|nr:chemotaxis response regulator protein-glutamate methylesterase [Oscillospiraceae bacterium]MDE6899550.1 chemotaxis response regulator protein-glutamate methylesterase [Oscillospiraceae bacterium]